MAKSQSYRAVFSEAAAELVVQLPKRRQREVLAISRKLAEHPFVRSDYRLSDEAGREIDHLLVDDYVFAFWLDHASREVRITDIEDAT